MPIQYGVHQDGDSFNIAPQLVNGDGKLNIGDVSFNIGAGPDDDVLSTPHLQVRSGAGAGKVLKDSDGQGNLAFVEDQKLSVYAEKAIKVSYSYSAVKTSSGNNVTFSNLEAELNTGDNVPIEGSVHIYLKNGQNVTEEVPVGEFTVATNDGVTTITLNEAPASNDAVVVYSYQGTEDITEEIVPVSTHVLLMHQSTSITSVTKLDNTPLSGWSRSNDGHLDLTVNGDIVGYNNREKFLALDLNGNVEHKDIAEPWETFDKDEDDTVYLTTYYSQRVSDEAITPTVGEGVATFTPDEVSADTQEIRNIQFSSDIPMDDQNGWTINDQTFEITLHGTAAVQGEGWPTVSYEVEQVSEREAKTVLLNNAQDEPEYLYISIPADDDIDIHSIEIFSTAAEGEGDRRYHMGQAWEGFAYPDGETPTEYRARFFTEPQYGMVPAYDGDGNSYWKNIALLINGDNRNGNVVTVNNGRLEYSDSAAVVELKRLLPDNPQEGQILKWNPQTDNVEWASDNDSWSAIADTAEPGLILGTDTNGDILFSNSFTVGEFSIATSDSLTGNGNINFNAGGAISFESVESFNVEASGNVNISTADAEAGSNESAQSINLTAGSGDGTGANGTITFELPDPNGLRLKLPKLNGAALTSADANTGLVLTVVGVDNEGVAQLGWAYCNDLIMLRPAT